MGGRARTLGPGAWGLQRGPDRPGELVSGRGQGEGEAQEPEGEASRESGEKQGPSLRDWTSHLTSGGGQSSHSRVTREFMRL